MLQEIRAGKRRWGGRKGKGKGKRGEGGEQHDSIIFHAKNSIGGSGDVRKVAIARWNGWYSTIYARFHTYLSYEKPFHITLYVSSQIQKFPPNDPAIMTPSLHALVIPSLLPSTQHPYWCLYSISTLLTSTNSSVFGILTTKTPSSIFAPIPSASTLAGLALLPNRTFLSNTPTIRSSSASVFKNSSSPGRYITPAILSSLLSASQFTPTSSFFAPGREICTT